VLLVFAKPFLQIAKFFKYSLTRWSGPGGIHKTFVAQTAHSKTVGVSCLNKTRIH